MERLTGMDINTSQIKLLQEQKEQQDYNKVAWAILKRRWWLVIIILLITEGFTFQYAKIPEGPYKASAVLRPVTPRSSATSYGMYIGGIGGGSFATETEFEIIKGRKVAEKVIDKLGLTELTPRSEVKNKDKSELEEYPPAQTLQSSLPPEMQRRFLVEGLQSRLEVRWKEGEGKRKLNLIEIVARSYSSKEAMNIANAVAEAYIDVYNSYKETAWRDLTSLLEAELERARKELEKSRNQLYNYANQKDVASAFGSLLGVDQYTISDLPQNISMLRSRILEKELQLQVLQRDFPDADPRVSSLKKEIEETKQRLSQEEEKAKVKYSEQFGLTSAKAEVAYNQQLYSMLVSSQQQLKSQYIMERQSPEIIEKALEPLLPSEQSRRSGLSMGAAVGVFLGVALALLIEYLDSSMRTPGDVAKSIGIPVIGRIPRLRGIKNRPKSDALITFNGAKLSRKSWVRRIYKESYRMLQLEMIAAVNEENAYNKENGSKKPRGIGLVVTSSVSEEGKSVVAVNLAISISQTGRKVLLVDSDCHRPMQHVLLGLDNTIGLTDILTGKANLDNAIKKSSIDNLSLIVSGQGDGRIDLSGILSSPEMEALVNLLLEQFDVVIFDSPPAALASESAAIGSMVDGILLVIKAGATKKNDILQSKEMIHYSGGNILGVALNFTSAERKDRRYYYLR